jgi:hypothetical protein
MNLGAKILLTACLLAALPALGDEGESRPTASSQRCAIALSRCIGKIQDFADRVMNPPRLHWDKCTGLKTFIATLNNPAGAAELRKVKGEVERCMNEPHTTRTGLPDNGCDPLSEDEWTQHVQFYRGQAEKFYALCPAK